jgi:hypothetical protein
MAGPSSASSPAGAPTFWHRRCCGRGWVLARQPAEPLPPLPQLPAVLRSAQHPPTSCWLAGCMPGGRCLRCTGLLDTFARIGRSCAWGLASDPEQAEALHSVTPSPSSSPSQLLRYRCRTSQGPSGCTASPAWSTSCGSSSPRCEGHPGSGWLCHLRPSLLEGLLCFLTGCAGIASH